MRIAHKLLICQHHRRKMRLWAQDNLEEREDPEDLMLSHFRYDTLGMNIGVDCIPPITRGQPLRNTSVSYRRERRPG